MCYGQVLSTKLQTARKEKFCEVCGKRIKRGAQQYKQVYRDDGLMEYVAHPKCVAIETVMDEQDGDGCSVPIDHDDRRAMAAEEGWRALLARARANLRAMRQRLSRKEQPK